MTSLIITEHAIRAGSKANHDDVVDDDHGNDIADEPHARTSALRPFEGSSSALDLNETGPAPSLALTHTLSSERVRRRSEIARIRPLDAPLALEPDTIELPVINEHAHARALPASTSTHVRGPGDVMFRKDIMFVPSKSNDVELMPSFPNSLAPSIRIIDADADADDSDTVPAISAAQKAVYRRKFLISFVTLCFSFFLEGWNDGTVGPLLPRIQAYYNVRSRVQAG